MWPGERARVRQDSPEGGEAEDGGERGRAHGA